MRNFNKKIRQINLNGTKCKIKKQREQIIALENKAQILQNLLNTNVKKVAEATIKQLETENSELKWIIKKLEDVINKQRFRIVDYQLKLSVLENKT